MRQKIRAKIERFIARRGQVDGLKREWKRQNMDAISIAKSGRAQSRVNPEPQDSGQNNDPTKVYPWKRVKLL